MAHQLTVSKYYTDCIDDNGNTFIGYIGKVKWRRFEFNYANYLFYNAYENQFYNDFSITKHTYPEWISPILNWDFQELNIVGKWQSTQPPIDEILMQNDESSIHWMCLQPKAHCGVKIKDFLVKGLGYTERLDFLLNPFDLPFESIRWGRFICPNFSLVWIEWRGKVPLKFVYLDGEKYENVEITDDAITIIDKDWQLLLTEKLELRKGSLLDTVFKKLAWLKGVFPLKMLNTYECKWRSKGILKQNNHSENILNGWAIHEIVMWK
jgi:hypothetical protein